MKDDGHYFAMFGAVACAIVVGGVALDQWREYQMRQTAAVLTAQLAATTQSLIRDLPRATPIRLQPVPSPRFWIPEQRNTVHVEAQDVKTCLSKTGGVVNEEFAKCRKGYDMTNVTAGHWNQ